MFARDIPVDRKDEGMEDKGRWRQGGIIGFQYDARSIHETATGKCVVVYGKIMECKL